MELVELRSQMACYHKLEEWRRQKDSCLSQVADALLDYASRTSARGDLQGESQEFAHLVNALDALDLRALHAEEVEPHINGIKMEQAVEHAERQYALVRGHSSPLGTAPQEVWQRIADCFRDCPDGRALIVVSGPRFNLRSRLRVVAQPLTFADLRQELAREVRVEPNELEIRKKGSEFPVAAREAVGNGDHVVLKVYEWQDVVNGWRGADTRIRDWLIHETPASWTEEPVFLEVVRFLDRVLMNPPRAMGSASPISHENVDDVLEVLNALKDDETSAVDALCRLKEEFG